MGGLNQFMITFGIMIASLFGLGVVNHSPAYPIVWRLIMGFPALVSITQLILLIFVFKFDSPLFDKKAFILFPSDDSDLTFSVATLDPTPKNKVLEGPKNFLGLLRTPYRGAFIVGCTLAMLQQLTGT
jgi:hypothetical protein